MPRLRWIIAVACAALLIFIAGTAYFFELQKIRYLRAAIEERSVRLADKERSVKEYREKINFYKTKEGIAHLAREQYNLAFPGEKVYVIMHASADRPPVYTELK